MFFQHITWIWVQISSYSLFLEHTSNVFVLLPNRIAISLGDIAHNRVSS